MCGVRRILSFLLSLLSVGRAYGREEPPKINLGGWLDSEVRSQWNYNTTPPLNPPPPFPDAISVPSTVQGMSLICNAPYPIEWRFHQERWVWKVKIQYAVQTTRISNGLDVVGFTSELSFLGFGTNTLSGNYTCQKVGAPNLSSSLFVFWEGTSPPYLTLAKLFRKPPQIPFKKESKSFKLPCTVSVPSVLPVLTKEVDQQVEASIPLNDSVAYDPRLGFTLTNLQFPFGRYTCQVGDAEEDGDGDIITFNVIDADDTPQTEFNETIKHGAYYSIDSTKDEVHCCSAGNKAPKLKLIECDHPTICAIMKHNLHDMESIKKKNGTCSTIQYKSKRAGLFRCVGAGIDVVREYFFPIPETGFRRWHGGGPPRKNSTAEATSTSIPPSLAHVEPYYDWYEADRAKMMQVTELTGPLFIGEMRKFTCKVSHFYYAKGIVWAIEYTNQSIEYVNGEEESLGRRHRYDPQGSGRMRHFHILLGRYQSFIEMLILENIKTVTCYAPVWNSTEWGKKGIDIEILKPTQPTILGRTREEYTWFLNDTDKSLVCKFDGIPTPNVTWTRNNKTISYGIQAGNGTSKLAFHRVSVDVQDVYECRIRNVAGNVTKKFRITVIHPASSFLLIVSTISVMGLIFMVVACIFLYRYLKSQKSIMQHLANLAFKDVTNADHNVQGERHLPQTVNTAEYTNGSAITHIPASQRTEHRNEERANNTNAGLCEQEQSFSDVHNHSPAETGGYEKF